MCDEVKVMAVYRLDEDSFAFPSPNEVDDEYEYLY